MGKSNASYKPSLCAHLAEEVQTGRPSLKFLREDRAASPKAIEALRRYSSSPFLGAEDGAHLNAALSSNSDQHNAWAHDMDGAFCWSFDRDVVLWRGGATWKGPSRQFISTTLVERTARRVGSRKRLGVLAILLPAGSPVAVPLLVLDPDTPQRTAGIVGREVEIILPRGTAINEGIVIRPFQHAPNTKFRFLRTTAFDASPNSPTI